MSQEGRIHNTDEPRSVPSTLDLLALRTKTLRVSERKAARHILDAPGRVALLPLKALAAECGVSEATVLRLCRALGFNGWQDFKISLIPELLGEKGGPVLGTATSGTSESVLGALSPGQLAGAASLVRRAQCTSVAGLGGSGAVGYILAEALTGLGYHCAVYADASFLQILPEALGPTDLAIGISHSGETREIAVVLRRAREQGASTIALTNYPGSEVDCAAEVSLHTAVGESILGSYSCRPRIAELLVIEALLAELSKEGRE